MTQYKKIIRLKQKYKDALMLMAFGIGLLIFMILFIHNIPEI